MAKQPLPYVLSDCDGTITPIYNNLLPETTADILAYQKKSNNRFSFITGRNGVVNKQLVADLKVTLPIVSCNGALITDTKTWKVLHAEYLDKDIVMRIIRQAEELGITSLLFDPEAIVGLNGTSRVNYWAEYRNHLKKKFNFDMKIYDDLTPLIEDIADEKVKVVEIIMVVETKPQISDLEEILAQYADEIDYSQSNQTLFNITKKGVTKASGLKKWAEIVDTHYRDVVVFGDNQNDVAMVKAVKYGYAMENGIDELKKVAYEVVGSIDDNGVGVKLQEIMNDEY